MSTLKYPDNTTGLTPLERINKLLSTSKYPDKMIGFASLERINNPLSTLKSSDKYDNISLNHIDNLLNRINNEITEGDNIVDLGNGKEIYFRDLANFLYDIKNGKINDFNKEIEYEKRLKNTEEKKRVEFSNSTRLYEQYINILKRELFSNKRPSGKGLTISSLPILLSKNVY